MRMHSLLLLTWRIRMSKDSSFSPSSSVVLTQSHRLVLHITSSSFRFRSVNASSSCTFFVLRLDAELEEKDISVLVLHRTGPSSSQSQRSIEAVAVQVCRTNNIIIQMFALDSRLFCTFVNKANKGRAENENSRKSEEGKQIDSSNSDKSNRPRSR